MVSRDPESPMYRQVAGILRDRIRGGQLAAGQRLGSERDLAHEFEVSVVTVGAALDVLRSEGLLAPGVSGRAARVRELVDIQVIALRRGSKVRSRPATPAERRGLDLPPNVWVLQVEHDGKITLYGADRTVLTSS